MVVHNKITGESFELDPARARVRRMQKRLKSWVEALHPMIQDSGKFRLVMVTLTYGSGQEWKAGHIRSFMLEIRKVLGQSLLAYSWVGELQERGAVHYHVLLMVKRGTQIPKPDESGLWPYGMTKIETARSTWYVMAYSGKEHQKFGNFPAGMRMFAIWVKKNFLAGETAWRIRLSVVPAWLYEQIKSWEIYGYQLQRKRGGWMVLGCYYESPWEVIDFE